MWKLDFIFIVPIERAALIGVLLLSAFMAPARAEASEESLLSSCPEVDMAARALAEGHLDTAARGFEKVYRDASVLPYARGLAMFGLAEIALARNDAAGAIAAWQRMAADERLLRFHRDTALRRMAEAERIRKGLPARDPASYRVQLPVLPEPGQVFYVSPTGSHSSDGTRSRPFHSLQRARDAVRSLKKSRSGVLPAGGVRIVIGAGEYPWERTLQLTSQDSGSDAAPVVYQAAPGETAVFRGGVKITGWKPISDATLRGKLDAAVRGRVLEADLKAVGVGDFGDATALRRCPELFVDGKPQTLARWPNEGFTKTGTILGKDTFKVWNSIDGCRDGKFAYVEDRPSGWMDEPDVRLYGYWFWDWFEEFQKVESIDPDARAFTLSKPYSRYGYRKDQRYYALNVFRELDTEGEWYLDRRVAKVYWLAPEGIDVSKADVVLSVVEQPFITMTDVEHVILRGLTLQEGRGNGIHIRGGADCLVENCTVRRLGGDAIIVEGGQRHGIFGCTMHTLGCGGTRVAGGDRQTLTPGRHFVENCRVFDISRLKRTYSPAVHLDGCGNRVAHNMFENIPSSAMRIEGNEHIIELNVIRNVVRESDDQGGLDMFGNPLYRGVVIRWNRWSDIRGGTQHGAAGVRLDDMISGVAVYGNIFERCGAVNFGGVQIHGGKENLVEGNLFTDCQAGLSFSRWNEKRWLESIERFLPQAAKPPYASRYPELADLKSNANVNFICRNVFAGCGSTFLRDGKVQKTALNVVADRPPQTQSSAKRAAPDDVALLSSLPAEMLRASLFEPIPIDEIGPYDPANQLAISVWNVSGTDSLRPVTGGVPLARGVAPDGVNFALHDLKDKPVPLQTSVLARWQDGSARWVLLDFQAEPAAESVTRFKLSLNEKTAVADPSFPVVVDRQGQPSLTTGNLVVETAQDALLRISDRVELKLTMTDGEGTQCTAITESVEVQTEGRMRSTLLLRGAFRDPDGQRVLGFRIRASIFAGLSKVCLEPQILVDSEEGVLYHSRELKFQVIPLGTMRSAALGGAPGWSGEPTSAVRLFQIDDQNYRFEGAPGVGAKAPGWAHVNDGQGTIAVALRDFWQQWPKSIEADSKGVAIGLFPKFEEGTFDHMKPWYKYGYLFDGNCYRLRTGQAPRWRIWLDLSGEGPSLAQAANAPLVPSADPAEAIASETWGDIAPAGGPGMKQYDDWAENLFDNGYCHSIEAQRDYGQMNWGDWFGERRCNWGNHEYDTAKHILVQFARTGNPKYFYVGDAAARHTSQVDVIHFVNDDLKQHYEKDLRGNSSYPVRPGMVHEHCVGHMSGFYSVERIRELYASLGNGSHLCLAPYNLGHIWTQGMVYDYFLTGDPWLKETVEKIGDNLARLVEDRKFNFRTGSHVGRVNGWTMLAIAGAYELDLNERYLNAMRLLADDAISAQDPHCGGWLWELPSGHCNCQTKHVGEAGFIGSVRINGLSRYYELSGDERIPEVVKRAMTHINNDTWMEQYIDWRYTSCPASGRVGQTGVTIAASVNSVKLNADPEQLRILRKAWDKKFERLLIAPTARPGLGKTYSQIMYGSPEAMKLMNTKTGDSTQGR